MEMRLILLNLFKNYDFLLDPKQKESIIDVCSAPGGKSSYIAEKQKNMIYDKKNLSGKLNFILCKDIGKAFVYNKVKKESIKKSIN